MYKITGEITSKVNKNKKKISLILGLNFAYNLLARNASQEQCVGKLSSGYFGMFIKKQTQTSFSAAFCSITKWQTLDYSMVWKIRTKQVQHFVMLKLTKFCAMCRLKLDYFQLENKLQWVV